MKVTIKEYATLIGTPEAILQEIASKRMMDNLEGEELIEEIKKTAMRAFDIALEVTGETYQEKAESLLKEMHKHNMITIEEE